MGDRVRPLVVEHERSSRTPWPGLHPITQDLVRRVVRRLPDWRGTVIADGSEAQGPYGSLTRCLGHEGVYAEALLDPVAWQFAEWIRVHHATIFRVPVFAEIELSFVVATDATTGITILGSHGYNPLHEYWQYRFDMIGRSDGPPATAGQA